ncbi:MAG: hypothetical protein AAGC55_24905, partial [Myxococcota bacterium]
LDAWIAGHDLVVDAAAPYPVQRFCPTSPVEAQPLAYAEQRTRAILAATERHRARLVLISSFVTLPRPRFPWQHLRSQLIRAAHPYFAVKSLIESLVLDAARAGLPAAVINPSVCLGPWDIKQSEFCLIPQLLRGQVLAAATATINVVDVREVARAAVAAAHSERYGWPIPVSGHNIQTHALLERIAELGGTAAPRLRAPLSAGITAAYWAEAALALSGRPSPYPALVSMLLGECYSMTIAREQHDLGALPRPLDHTLGDAIAWYRAIGYC